MVHGERLQDVKYEKAEGEGIAKVNIAVSYAHWLHLWNTSGCKRHAGVCRSGHVNEVKQSAMHVHISVLLCCRQTQMGMS